MFKVALKSLLGYKRRLVLTLFSIVLSVGFVAASFIFSDSIRSTFTSLFEDVFNVDVSVRTIEEDIGFGSSFGQDSASLPESIVDDINAVEGVAVAAPTVIGSAVVLDNDGEVITTQGPPILGFSWLTEPTLSPINIQEGNGRAPEGPGEVVLDANTIRNFDFSVGDNLQLEGPEGVEEFELVGAASFGEEDSLAGAILVLFEFEEAQRMFDLDGRVSIVDINAVEGVSQEELRSRISEVLPEGVEAVTGDQQTAEQIDDINEGLGFITTFLLVFAAVAVFVGAFIIQNTFRIILSQRSKELALLRAVGATKKQVVAMVAVEALIVSIAASLLGVLAGLGLAKMLSFGLEQGGFGLPEGPLRLLPRTFIVSIIVGVVVTLFSALVPARRASKVSPVEAIRGQVDVGKRKPLVVRFILGAILSIIGAIAIWYGLFGDPPFNRLYAVGVGVPSMFLGVSIMSPLLVRPFAAIFGYPLRKLFKVTGSLAAGNIVRSPRRTASTASALMIGVALVTLVGIFAGSIKGTIDDVITESFPADLTFQNVAGQRGPLPESGVSFRFTQDLSALPETDEISPIYADLALYQFNDQEDQDRDFLYGVDPATFNSVLSLEPDDGNYDKLNQEDSVYVNAARLESIEAQLGDNLDITLSNGQDVQFTVVGTYEEQFDSDYLISLNNYERYIEPSEYSIVFANYADGFDEANDRAAVDELAANFPSIEVQNAGELVEDAKMQIDQILSLIWGLLAMTVLIAILGIANTLTLSITERTREIGLLRAVGMTRRQVRRTIRLESALLALFGTTIGIAMGIFFAWVILKALEDEGLSSFVVSPSQIAIYVVVALLAAFLASLIPSWRASKTSVLEAINYE